MKKITIFAMLAIACMQNSFAQKSIKTNPSHLLYSYYAIKNALVAGNADTASAKAGEFISMLNGVDQEIIDKDTRQALLNDAGNISGSTDLKLQRAQFATFSTRMFALAKTVKLNTDAIYYQYCPMKKAYWLSNESDIKNPYYGNMMLTCGKVSETLK